MERVEKGSGKRSGVEGARAEMDLEEGSGKASSLVPHSLLKGLKEQGKNITRKRTINRKGK